VVAWLAAEAVPDDWNDHVSSGRHRQTRKRTTNPVLRAAALAAPVATLGAVGVGVANAEIGLTSLAASAPIDHASSRSDAAAVAVPFAEAMRGQQISRSSERLGSLAREGKVDRKRVDRKRVDRKRVTRFTTDDLDVRKTPTENADAVTMLTPGTKVTATGLRKGRFAEISWRGEYRWVTAQYLSVDKPAAPATMGLSNAPCPDGSVENGLTSSAVRVYRAVCHNFPQITSYGGYDNHGEHASGRAIDIMTSDVTIGTEIATFLQAHAAELELYDVIWRQQIWTPVRSSEGFRSMPSRGSATANHYDHVHVSVY